MDEWVEDGAEDVDLRYTCPNCKRIFAKPTPDWLCPSCKETLRVLGALRLHDKRRRSTPRSPIDLDSTDL